MKTNYSIVRYRNLLEMEAKIAKSNNIRHTVYCSFLMFFYDPFIVKFINKLMRKGKKKLSIIIFRNVLLILKKKIGFQPFFILKNIAFQSRQLFRLRRIVFKKRKKVSYKPFFLKSHNQVAYSINHIIKCAKSLNNITFYESLSVVLLNCFFLSINRQLNSFVS